MKKTLFLLLLIAQFSFGQSYSILNSAEGKLQIFTSIYQDKELYGYVEVRKMNTDKEHNVTFKYIVLDVNFNKLCTGNLEEKESPSRSKRDLNDINFSNGFLRFDFSERNFGLGDYLGTEGFGTMSSYFKTYQVLDVKSNIVVNKGIYSPTVQVFDKKQSIEDKYQYQTYELKDVGFLISINDYFGKENPKEKHTFYAVNYKNEKIWEYKSTRKMEKYTLNYGVYAINENYIVLQGFFSKGWKREDTHFVVLDSKTGKELFSLPRTKEYTVTSLYAGLEGDKLYVFGKFYKKDKKEEFKTEESLGIYQTVIDLKTNQIIQDKYVNYQQFKNIEVNKYGKVRGEGFLDFKRFKINPDGSIFIIAESYWQKSKYRAYTQLYAFEMDENFKSIKTTEYDVKRTKGYKYNFSQKLPSNAGMAYFFFDKNDDKDLELNILNYYYKSEKQEIQKMPINNDKSAISIFPAKSGYVGIAEYFKDPEKEGKYMEIRLEKLNYERE